MSVLLKLNKIIRGIRDKIAELDNGRELTNGGPASAQQTPKTVLGITKVAKSLEVKSQKF
jgi:hypothetical protein